jgi:hypothetical protein
MPAPPGRRQVRLGEMKDRIRLLTGWDDPIDIQSLIDDNE